MKTRTGLALGLGALALSASLLTGCDNISGRSSAPPPPMATGAPANAPAGGAKAGATTGGDKSAPDKGGAAAQPAAAKADKK